MKFASNLRFKCLDIYLYTLHRKTQINANYKASYFVKVINKLSTKLSTIPKNICLQQPQTFYNACGYFCVKENNCITLHIKMLIDSTKNIVNCMLFCIISFTMFYFTISAIYCIIKEKRY